jgi:hypothetical protein
MSRLDENFEIADSAVLLDTRPDDAPYNAVFR